MLMMESVHRLFAIIATLLSLLALAKARAVNISNTWMLPEERFSVFYRYFRDRISWYEADAVCQFHHANLVTADSSAQYDAIRAYLKELDITDNVWIGLSKTTEKPNFAWTDFKPLNNEGHWQHAIPIGNDPLCVAMDPAADFLWKPLSCGGPDVASFICELPVPSWALGPKGCLLSELPSLTVLYIPEQLALELTSDCGLDGTKRIACKGNADREEMLKQLTCNIPNVDYFETEKSTRPSVSSSSSSLIPSSSSSSSSSSMNTASSIVSEAIFDENTLNSKTTKPWFWTSNTIDIDYGMPTRHRRETENTLNPSSTRSTTDLSVSLKLKDISTGKDREMIMDKSNDFTPLPPISSSSTSDNLNVTTEFVEDLQATTTTTTTAATTTFNSVTENSIDVETNGGELKASEEIVEYPSAINQGQLFSIIENGTMFDIIELNETVTDDVKATTKEDILSSQPITSPHSTPIETTPLITTNTPIPLKNLIKSDKLLKNSLTKKEIYKKSDPKKANYPKTNQNKRKSDKTLNDEVEMLPIFNDNSPKLNRTFRKYLPGEQQQQPQPQQELIDENRKFQSNSPPIIDPHLNILNKNLTNSNNSETVPSTTTTTTKTPPQIIKKETFLPKSLMGADGGGGGDEVDDLNINPSDEPLEAVPEIQPRPNRKRQLTRPQRRSYYPYFFSRVLG